MESLVYNFLFKDEFDNQITSFEMPLTRNNKCLI